MSLSQTIQSGPIHRNDNEIGIENEIANGTEMPIMTVIPIGTGTGIDSRKEGVDAGPGSTENVSIVTMIGTSNHILFRLLHLKCLTCRFLSLFPSTSTIRTTITHRIQCFKQVHQHNNHHLDMDRAVSMLIVKHRIYFRKHHNNCLNFLFLSLFLLCSDLVCLPCLLCLEFLRLFCNRYLE